MYKIVPKRACSGTRRITKRYLLAILPSYPDTQYVIEVATGNKIRIDSIESIEDSLQIRNGLYKNKYMPIEKAYPRKILQGLKDSDWKIKSFNNLTREVCFSIKDKNFSYTIPENAFL